VKHRCLARKSHAALSRGKRGETRKKTAPENRESTSWVEKSRKKSIDKTTRREKRGRKISGTGPKNSKKGKRTKKRRPINRPGKDECTKNPEKKKWVVKGGAKMPQMYSRGQEGWGGEGKRIQGRNAGKLSTQPRITTREKNQG